MKASITITAILMTLWLAPTASAQDDDKVDSLRQALYASSDDKEKAKICIEIGEDAYAPDTVIKYTQMALKTIDLIDLEGMARCYSSQAWAYFIKRDFNHSLDKYQRAAALLEKINKPGEAAMTYVNIGACYRYTNKYKEMWENLYRGLDKAEQAHDTANLCYAYSEIADVYQNQKMGKLAQEKLMKALKLAEQTHNYAEMGAYAKQLGSIVSPENTDIEGVKKAKSWAMQAEEYFSKAESEKPLDDYYEAIRYNNYAEIIYCNLALAKFYYDDRYIDSSKRYIELYDNFANNISPVADNKITDLHIHARQLMYEQKYRRAIDSLQKCIAIARRENFDYLDNITYDLLAQSYEQVGDFKNALLYINKYCDAEQSLSGSDAVAQTIAYNIQYKIEKEKRDIDAEKNQAQERKDEIERQKQRTYTRIIIISVAGILIIVIIIYYWIVAQRAVKNIATRNAQILKQQIMINDQKKELQETSEKIRQSMYYAQRIQTAATSSPEELETVFPGSMLIYRPQEIVGGDWYWARRTEHQRYIAVGGSSEHGVPGAMACMLVADSLKEAVSKITSDAKASPSEILSQVLDKARGSIGAGVEIAITLCIIDDNGTLKIAAINNDAVTIRDGEADIISANRHEDTTINTTNGQTLFLYSQNTRRIIENAGSTPQKFCKMLAETDYTTPIDAISAITGGQLSGDITVVGLKIQ